MTVKSYILCIFEGEGREVAYFKTMKNIYFSENNFVVCCFGNDIYELYKKIKKDEDLDILEILRESSDVPRNAEILEPYARDDFSQVFLFFDFECQDEQFCGRKLLDMIDLFDEETDNGKIFISYPMIEAIRDIPHFDTYINHKVHYDNCRGRIYKGMSADGETIFNDPRHNDKNNWDKLVKINIQKANFITSGNQHDLITIPQQDELATKQIDSLNQTREIFVISSYPLFIYHQKASSFDLQNTISD